MESVTRRQALGVAASGCLLSAPIGAVAQGDKGGGYNFEAAEPAKSCRLLARTIDGTRAQAQVVQGIINGTYFLVVSGKKPYGGMRLWNPPAGNWYVRGIPPP
jgi:hypothetical protein